MSTSRDRELTFAGVMLLANRMQSTYDAALGEVTLKQWLALAVIARMPQPVPSTSVVAGALGTTHQNVRKLLGALADKGLLTLAPSPDDARARAISLTPAALAYFEENEHTGAQLLDTLFDGVPTDDIATCLRVLNAMSINLTGAALTPSET